MPRASCINPWVDGHTQPTNKDNNVILHTHTDCGSPFEWTRVVQLQSNKLLFTSTPSKFSTGGGYAVLYPNTGKDHVTRLHRPSIKYPRSGTTSIIVKQQASFHPYSQQILNWWWWICNIVSKLRRGSCYQATRPSI